MAAPIHQMGLSPELDAAMRAQFENQAAFHAAAAAAPVAPIGIPGLPGLPPNFGLPPMPGQPGGLPPLPADFQAKLGQMGQMPGLAPSAFGSLLQPSPPGFPGLAGLAGMPTIPGLGQPPVMPTMLQQPPLQPQSLQGPPIIAGSRPDPNQAQNQEQARAAAIQTAHINKIKKDQLAKDQAVMKDQADKKKCHLHSKSNKKCKFCQRYEDFVKGAQDAIDAKNPTNKASSGNLGDDMSADRSVDLVNSKTFGFSPLLQTHIVESAHLKALLTLETFDQLVDEMYQFADNIEPYMTNSSTTPSALFCCLYRLFTMGIDSRQLRRLIDTVDNPYVRCTGFLFIRFGLPSDQLWPWLGEYVLDDEELRPAKDSEWFTTIGEFVEGLLSQDKYYSTVLPRLPMSTKRQLEAKLAPIVQYRKRTKANLDLLDVYRTENVKVEANSNGDWIGGMTVELIDDAPSRLKVRVRLEDSTEEIVHLGKVILSDRRYAGYSGASKRTRSRSRSRTDWARDKGKTDKELVDAHRTKDREKAVCSSGKEYARKPLGYKASCALPREQGTASTRLMEEETFVPMKQGRRRSPSPAAKEQEFRKAPSQEHQARMQALFEKYGMGKTDASSSSRQDIDTPDVMRLG